MDLAQEEEARVTEGPTSSSPPVSLRRTITTGYDGVLLQEPDLFTYLLDEIRRIETELGHLPQKWYASSPRGTHLGKLYRFLCFQFFFFLI